jgi:NAD(P)-dependent dehydrogenase (short-subunit alcohol dehydrogenase family)
MNQFILVAPASRGFSRALTRHFLQNTKLPVYATHRSGNADDVKSDILSPLKDVDPSRLRLLPLNLRDESSIKSASVMLSESLQGDDATMNMGWFTGGVLYPERQPADLDIEKIRETFEVNVISHLLLIKHFAHFLPKADPRTDGERELSKWVHMSARVGSVSDNKRGGWYSYRSSKAALNQVVKTFDIQLQNGLGGGKVCAI